MAAMIRAAHAGDSAGVITEIHCNAAVAVADGRTVAARDITPNASQLEVVAYEVTMTSQRVDVIPAN
jgi:hypothetical protein